MFFKKKKNKEEKENLDVVDDLKEPFSMQRFIDEQVVDRWNKFRGLMSDYGILFFFTSPFQYRNRLVIKVFLIALGVLVGIVPRTMTLVDEAKERNAASELAQIADKEYSVGMIDIEPLQSSQFEEQHVVVFNIEGDTTDGVPSTADKFDVDLQADRGVAEEEKVTYSYDIVPVTNSKRLLVMYVDNSEQDDDTGIYTLNVNVKGDDVLYPADMEVVLSDNQETNALFDENGVDLSPVTTKMEDDESTVIAEAQEKLDDKMEAYELMDERLEIDNIKPGRSFADMEKYVDDEMILPDITDESTVEDIKKGSEKFDNTDDTGRDKDLNIYASIEYQGEEYELSDDDDIPDKAEEELDELQSLTDEITGNLTTLNEAKISKYDRLVELQPILTKDIIVEDFPIRDMSIIPEEREDMDSGKLEDIQTENTGEISDEELSDDGVTDEDAKSDIEKDLEDEKNDDNNND